MAEKIFRFIDTSHDGLVDLNELLKLARTDDQELEELPQLFRLMDMDMGVAGIRRGDGAITLDQFLEIFETAFTGQDDAAYSAALLALLQGSFTLPKNRVAPLDRVKRAAAVFADVDEDGSGALSLAEYRRAHRAAAGLEEDDHAPARADEEAQAEFDSMDVGGGGREGARGRSSGGGAGGDGVVELDEFVTRLCATTALLNDDEFEVHCRKLTRHMRGPPNFVQRNALAIDVFKALDIDGSGELSMAEVMRLVDASEGDEGSKSREALPLFFRHLDAMDAAEGGDEKITLSEWQSGFVGSLSHYTDREVEALCRGMIAHIEQHRLSSQMLGMAPQLGGGS